MAHGLTRIKYRSHCDDPSSSFAKRAGGEEVIYQIDRHGTMPRDDGKI